MASDLLRNSRLDLPVLTPSSKEVDLRRIVEIEQFIRDNRPSVVINFAAKTDVNAGESERGNERGDFYRINTTAATELQRLSEQYRFYLLQISSDMCLKETPDNSAPFAETAMPHFIQSDLTWYGYTKGRAEDLIDTRFNATLRMIYPIPIDPPYPLVKVDYARIPIHAYRAGKILTYWDDQHINMSSGDDVRRTIEVLVKERRPGRYQVAAPNITTPYDFVEKLISETFGVHDSVKRSSIETAYAKGLARYRYQNRGGLAVVKTMKELDLSFATTDEIAEAVARAEKKRN